MTQYEIEALRKKRTQKGRVEFLVKWKGFPEEENTWECEKQLVDDGQEALVLYFTSRTQTSKKTSTKNVKRKREGDEKKGTTNTKAVTKAQKSEVVRTRDAKSTPKSTSKDNKSKKSADEESPIDVRRVIIDRGDEKKGATNTKAVTKAQKPEVVRTRDAKSTPKSTSKGNKSKKSADEESPIDVRRVIIDTDPGIDDTMALFLALNSPELHVEGLTIVMGNNNDQDLLARNACMVLQMARMGGACGLSDDRFVPVIKGASEPLAGDYHGQSGIVVHGDNGIGGVKPPVSPIDHSPLTHEHVSAASYMVKKCMDNPKEITIVALGPLTNLALAVKIGGKAFIDSVRSVVMMGGTVGATGNKTPCAEANTANDPEAARIVFSAFPDITMAGLNVTHQVSLEPITSVLKSYGKHTIGRFCFETTKHYTSILTKFRASAFVHDSSAIMAMIRPDIFESKKVCIDVSTEGITAGVTVADWKGHWAKLAQTTVLMEVDAKEYVAEYIQRISKYSPYKS